MSLPFRIIGIFLLAVTLFLPGVYYKAEVKALNYEREQQIIYMRGTMELYYIIGLNDPNVDALGMLFWAGRMIQEIEALKVPIVSHMDPTYALGDFYFGWIIN